MKINRKARKLNDHNSIKMLRPMSYNHRLLLPINSTDISRGSTNNQTALNQLGYEGD